MLTHKILRSSTFGLVVLYMLLVSASVFVLFGYIYWATVGYIARQTDLTIRAGIRGLAEQYRQLGVAGLTAGSPSVSPRTPVELASICWQTTIIRRSSAI